MQRYVFQSDSVLGLQLNRKIPPVVLSVEAGSSAAKMTPPIPIGGIVVRVNGFTFAEEYQAETHNEFTKRPLILDIQAPQSQTPPGTAEVRELVPPSVHQPPTQQGPQRQVEAVPNATESVQGVNEASGCKRSGSEKVDQNTTAKCINEKDASSSTSESESESGLFGFEKVVLPDD